MDGRRMKRLFCCIKNKIHCLAIKEKIEPGLCVCINDQPVSVITEEDGTGDVVIKNNNINKKIIYRSPGIFYYFHHSGSGSLRNFHAIYIENGIGYDVEVGEGPRTIGHIYYDKSSGLYYSFRYAEYGAYEMRYSYDGINFSIRLFSIDTEYVLSTIPQLNGYQYFNWFDLELLEVVPDNNGGFNLVFCVKSNHPNRSNEHYIFCHSFNIKNIKAHLTVTDDVNYSASTLQSNYPVPPQFFDDPPIYTINGFVERKIDNTHYAFEKDNMSYILSTNKIIYDPVVGLYFMLKFGPEYPDGRYIAFDLNLYSSDNLDEDSFVIVQKIKTYNKGDQESFIRSSLSAARQNEYV